MRITDNFGVHAAGPVFRPAPAPAMPAMQPLATDPVDQRDEVPAPELDLRPSAPDRPLPRTVAVSALGVETLSPRADGGTLVEAETGTVAYTGPAARAFLGEPRRFDHETEVVIPDGARARITVGAETCHVDESGVVLIPAGTVAKVEVDRADPLIITSERAPGWYRKHKPDTPFYQDIARLNQQIVDGRTTLRAAFPQALLQKLEEHHVVEDEGKRVRWVDVRNPDALRERLAPLGLPEAWVDQTERLWSDTIRRSLYGHSAGRVPRSAFREEDVQRLVDTGLVLPMRLSPQELRWTRYHTEDEVRGRLHEGGFQGAEADRVVDVWRATCHAGYDVSGINWQKDGVVLYTHRGRMNMWSETQTEWLVASTSYAGKNEPFTVGVSTVRAAATPEGPLPFRQIRPAESLHSHPVSEGATQTEAYLVSKGKGALLTVQDGRPVLEILHAGDMAVLQPGVKHAVLAVDGDYEQLVFQVPSTFQYGFRFKESHEYSDLGMSYETILETARRELAKGTRGTVPVVPRPPAAAPDVLVEGL